MSYFASTLGVYFFPGAQVPRLSGGLPYLLGWCALIAASCERGAQTRHSGRASSGSGRRVYMAGSACSHREPAVGNRDLILATVFAPLIYFALYLIPVAVTVFPIPRCSCPCSRCPSGGKPHDRPRPAHVREPPARAQEHLRAGAERLLAQRVLHRRLRVSCGVVRSIAVETPGWAPK
ncbi:MAG: hypothetical protein ACLT98_12950 [Eggerthellaceae bacterium]